MPIVAHGGSAALVRRLYTKPQGRFAFRAQPRAVRESKVAVDAPKTPV